MEGVDVISTVWKWLLLELENNLHNEVSGEADQREEDVFERRGQSQGLVTERAQMSRLDGTDVALGRDGVVGERITLREETRQVSRTQSLFSNVVSGQPRRFTKMCCIPD